MKFLLVLFVSVVGLAAISASAGAQTTTAGKPPEVRTILPPELSPPLSASQLAKQRMSVSTVAPVSGAAPVAGVKLAPVSTSLPPDPKFADARAKAAAAKLHPTPQQLVERDLAIAQGRMPAPFAATPPRVKPASLVTELPEDPSMAGARATAMANKLAHAHSATATRAGSKPASLSTSGPAPTTVSPEQASKRAQSTAASPRRPQ